MNRLRTTSNFENSLKSRLFQQLFRFQIDLEEFNNDHFEHQTKIQEIIHSIDELMESILLEKD